MNLKEGQRRLAILLGLAGSIFGATRSYTIYEGNFEARAQHNRYEELSSAPFVQRARGAIEIHCADGHSDQECGDDNYVPMSELNTDGIKTIYWKKAAKPGKIEYHPSLIQTEDGQNLFPTSVVTVWNDPLFLLYPILGLIVPWGTVRAIGWVQDGFVAGSKKGAV